MSRPWWFVVLIPAMVSFAWSNSPLFERQFRSDDAAAGDEFGRSVSIDGTLGIVGAPLRDEADPDSGAAFVFDLSTGQQLHKLIPNDLAAEDAFGTSVAIQGNRAIVGALHDDDHGTSSGSAYIFDVNTGQQLHKLTASDASAGDEFGVSVAIDGGIAIVGAHMDGEGSAYLFDVETGQQQMRIQSDDKAPEDLFGVAVALDSGRALVGARYDDDLGIASGSAYVFDVNTGDQLQKLNALDGAWGDRFGMYLDISGDRAVVASRYDDDVKKSSGSAYIFDVETGSQLFKIVADDADPNDHFGSGVATDGDLVLIGAVNDDDFGPYSGSAYLFDMTNGQQLAKITSDDVAPLDQFGQSVALDGRTALIGATMLNYAGSPQEPLPSGKAYVYSVPEPSCCALLILGMLFLTLWRGRS